MASHLGLSCPSKGKFYTCENAKIRFVGCCTVDPCADGSGECPPESLATTSFSSSSYENIPAQGCATSQVESLWYTCVGSQPFLGCCTSNPCGGSGCPEANLTAATLSDDSNDAQVFLDASTPSNPSPSSSPSAPPAPSDANTYSLPLGGILGIALGGLAIVAILLAFLAYRCGWLARKKKGKRDQDTLSYAYTMNTQGPFSPGLSPAFHDHPYKSEPSSLAPSPGFPPYSPSYAHTPPPVASPEPWQSHSKQVSELSSTTNLDLAALKGVQTQSMPLLSPHQQHIIELDGQHIAKPHVAELPSQPREEN